MNIVAARHRLAPPPIDRDSFETRRILVSQEGQAIDPPSEHRAIVRVESNRLRSVEESTSAVVADSARARLPAAADRLAGSPALARTGVEGRWAAGFACSRRATGDVCRILHSCRRGAQGLTLRDAQHATQTGDAPHMSSQRSVARHEDCSRCGRPDASSGRPTDRKPAQKQARHHDWCSSRSEGLRGDLPLSLPSTRNPLPDPRERARLEWRVRQPSRRDSQCVPN